MLNIHNSVHMLFQDSMQVIEFGFFYGYNGIVCSVIFLQVINVLGIVLCVIMVLCAGVVANFLMMCAFYLHFLSACAYLICVTLFVRVCV